MQFRLPILIRAARHIATRRACLLACMAAVAACDGSRAPTPTEPGPTPPPTSVFLHLVAVGETERYGIAGEPLAAPITVEVRDEAGRPAPGVRLSFAAHSGSVSAASQTTDAAGRAAALWTLGWTPGTQLLTVAVDSGGTANALNVRADAEPNPAADVIIAAGAQGREVRLLFIADNVVRDTRTLASGDSIFYMAPDTDLTGQWIAALARGRMPAVAGSTSTAGTDTTRLSLDAPFAVPLTVWLVDATPAVRAAVDRDLATTSEFWRGGEWGLDIGDVRRIEVPQTGPGISCPTAPAGDSLTINIFYSIDAQILPWGGMACSARTIIMRQLSGSPYLLAHEIGHSLGLGHPFPARPSNFMDPTATQSGVLPWQIFNSHFSSFSALNSVYGLRTAAERQACCIAPNWASLHSP